MATAMKFALVIIGQRTRKVGFSIGSKQKDLFEPIRKKFADIGQFTDKISYLQLWDKEFEEFVDLDDEDEIPASSKIKVVLKVRSRKAKKKKTKPE